jgi:glycosyltransferase involved in cell wall biosynthesis
MKLVIVGHACSPLLGSEPGNTWNWAWHLSARHSVWVITHPQYRADIENFMACRPGRDIHFVWITPPRAIDPWRPWRSDRLLRIHYLMWLGWAYRAAARLHREVGLDLCHHVSLNTVSAPPPFWRLPMLKVWGPVGGGHQAPIAFRSYYGPQWRKQSIRDFRIRVMPHLPVLRRAVRAASLVLATNRETEALLREAGARDVRLFLDCGIPETTACSVPESSHGRRQMTLLWAGRLEKFKALPIALEALKRQPSLPVKLIIAGDGPARGEWEELTARMNLTDRVTFRGKVPFNEMQSVFREADAFLFTSLCDSSGSVVLEAMSHGLPVITLDHQGIGTFAPADAAIKIPVTTPEETVAAFSQAMAGLSSSPDKRHEMGIAARRFATSQVWTRRAEQMNCWYEELAGAHRNI